MNDIIRTVKFSEEADFRRFQALAQELPVLWLADECIESGEVSFDGVHGDMPNGRNRGRAVLSARVGLGSFLKRPDEGCGFHFCLVAENRLFDRIAAGVVDLGLAESLAGCVEGFPSEATFEGKR